MPSVYPSGSALATTLAPMMLLPPGRFSITTGTPHFPCSTGAMTRISTSVDPPAGYGTTILTGLLGNSAEKLICGAMIAVTAATTIIKR
ncbi:hypothetical protein D3C86_1531290 [compost metagenome]